MLWSTLMNFQNTFVPEPNCAKISQQLGEIKKEILEEIKAIKRNETGGNGTRGLYRLQAKVIHLITYSR